MNEPSGCARTGAALITGLVLFIALLGAAIGGFRDKPEERTTYGGEPNWIRKEFPTPIPYNPTPERRPSKDDGKELCDELIQDCDSLEEE